MTMLKRAFPALQLFFAVTIVSISFLGMARRCHAQAAAGGVPVPVRATALSGTVADPSGAVVSQAILRFALRGASAGDAGRSIATDAAGRYTVDLPAGVYGVVVDSPGFQTYSATVTIGAKSVRLDVKLAVAAAADELDVSSDGAASTSPADNKSALVFKGQQLDALSNDDSTFQQEITAMAGGGGEGGAQVYVDGFTGSRFPPKDQIREVRINSNPFSTQFEDLGFGRVEVFTKPGSDKLHGSFFALGSDDVLNARNPYTGTEPPYYFTFFQGSLSGPLGKKTSFFLSSEFNDLRNNAVVNAFNADGSSLSEAVPDPQTNTSVAARIDRQVTANDTLTTRYEYNRSNLLNSGVGLLVLPSEGVNSLTTTQTLQMGNTQLIGTKIVSETRFQYLRTRVDQSPEDTSPTIVVQGAFSGGGAPGGTQRDNQDHYELQEYLSVSAGKHFIRAGGKYRLVRDSNTSSANYNGQFTFPSLAAYLAKTPSQFSLTAGRQNAAILSGDLGLYAEDEWKVRRNVTLTYGMRLETESGIPGQWNPAPRAAASWAVGQTDKHQPFAVIRANGGLFYQRFAAENILTSVRENGVSQQSYFVTDPAFYPALPAPAALSGTPPTPYRIDPHLHVAEEIIGGVTVEKAIGKIGSVTGNYLAVRGVHQYASLNINAPLPGTYNPADPNSTGVRPLGGNQNIYQFSSPGIEKAQTFYMNTNLHPAKRVSLFGFYSYRHQMSDTFGAGSFPSQPYDVSADYGASGLGFRAVRQRLFVGGNFTLPYGISANTFFAVQGRARFNITTGTDLNGDTQYTDRPAFATNPGPSSVVYNTRYGSFDANPQPGEAIIPYNYAKGPGIFFSAMGLNKEFKFGPRPAAEPAPAGVVPPAPGKAVAPKPDPRYSLVFSVESANVFNHVNAGPPVGVLSSPFFGQSISLNGNFSASTSANRLVFLESSFHF